MEKPEKCNHCREPIKHDMRNPVLMAGFRDAGTHEPVCPACRFAQYREKNRRSTGIQTENASK